MNNSYWNIIINLKIKIKQFYRNRRTWTGSEKVIKRENQESSLTFMNQW